LATYVEIVTKKTASLFAASAQCGATMGGGDAYAIKALRDFGLFFGIAFQMKDDLLDMTADPQALGKPVGNDLAERKITIPLIFALQRADGETKALVERFYEGSKDSGTTPIVEAIRRLGGLDATRAEIRRYIERAKRCLESLEDSPAKIELGRLADGLMEE
jgi:octaprenyl-diphosphate synthase